MYNRMGRVNQAYTSAYVKVISDREYIDAVPLLSEIEDTEPLAIELAIVIKRHVLGKAGITLAQQIRQYLVFRTPIEDCVDVECTYTETEIHVDVYNASSAQIYTLRHLIDEFDEIWGNNYPIPLIGYVHSKSATKKKYPKKYWLNKEKKKC